MCIIGNDAILKKAKCFIGKVDFRSGYVLDGRCTDSENRTTLPTAFRVENINTWPKNQIKLKQNRTSVRNSLTHWEKSLFGPKFFDRAIRSAPRVEKNYFLGLKARYHFVSFFFFSAQQESDKV